jgi:hypothetical protein
VVSAVVPIPPLTVGFEVGTRTDRAKHGAAPRIVVRLRNGAAAGNGYGVLSVSDARSLAREILAICDAVETAAE